MAWRAISLGLLSCGLLSASNAVAQVPATAPTSSKVVSTAPPAPAAAASAPAPNSVERARQGVVVLERQGKALALGVVLEGDGRILTALSPLATGNFLSARYSDGALVPLKLVHSDRGWDLALLTPQATSAAPVRKTGLRAARTPSFVGLQTFTVAGPSAVTVAPAALRISADMLGGDAVSLSGAYELGGKVSYVGAPVVNETGEAVALIARACPAKSAANCTPVPYGVPVPALKQFLQKVPAEATWLGVETTLHDAGPVRGVRVVSIIPGSPAAVAGLRPGTNAAQADLIVAVDGTPVGSPADLNEAVRARTAGDSLELLLYGLGRYRHVSVKPSPAPQLIEPPYTAPKPGKPRTPNPYR
jgi:S1-C subfamily serine protease